MVGYRNDEINAVVAKEDFIRHSDGGVSEQGVRMKELALRLYQAFRWWGIGTP